jgi:hypothetical protein
MHPDVSGMRTDACPKCGMELDQRARVLPQQAGAVFSQRQTVRASIRTATPLTAGQPAKAYLNLAKTDGSPVLLKDLIETHTEKIHLLIINSSLRDYHHEHPRPTDVPGEFEFSFTPRKPGSYRVWADLRVHPLGFQEYVMTDISAPTPDEPLTEKAVNSTTEIDGLHFELTFDRKRIRAVQAAPARLRITNRNGTPFNQLEPVMAAFAHVVGFNEDYKTVLHIHPKGPPVSDPKARGGPELEFLIYSLQPGFFRLFVQVQIGGVSKFAPFGIEIIP